MYSVVNQITDWFVAAVPEPEEKNQSIQLAVHIEEFSEMLDRLTPVNVNSLEELQIFKQNITRFQRFLKENKISYTISKENRVEFLDSICDQIVTGIGLAYMHDMDVYGALQNVADSNDSKFDDNGMPIFNEQKKIIKGPNYVKPNLVDFV